MPIHSTAIVDRHAEIDSLAEIGPYVVIDGPVRVGPRTRVLAHATLTGWTEVGADNLIHIGAAIGGEPQDLAFAAAESYVRIGDRNIIREHVQVHRGTKAGTATVIGNDNFLMCNAHVGHNCQIGNGVILTNGALLGGYVEVADGAIVSGNCVVHQFVRIGRLAMLRGLSKAARDVPPFCIMDGTHTLRALNRVGLRRAGFDTAQISALQRAFRMLFRTSGNLSLRLVELEHTPCTPEVRELIAFIRVSKRGVSVGVRRSGQAPDSEA